MKFWLTVLALYLVIALLGSLGMFPAEIDLGMFLGGSPADPPTS